jgi:hypothetical protein
VVGIMEKTLHIQLAEQRDAIRQAIIDEPEPQDMSWQNKVIWEMARIRFTTIVNEAADADIRI